MAHVRDRPSLRESVEITTPSGNRYRWADDEDNAANVPSGERFTDTMPGGFAEHDAVLPRKPAVDYADLERLSTITRYDASGGIIWQGRLERAPKVSGDKIAISPSAVGWQAYLEDDKSARMVYVDRDLSKWSSVSASRRAGILAASQLIQDHQLLPDISGTPELLHKIKWDTTQAARIESNYVSSSDLGSIYYEFTGPANPADANWNMSILSADDDNGTGQITEAGNIEAASATGTATITAKQKVITLFTSYGGAVTGVDGQEDGARWRRLVVFGAHSLTKRGDAPDQGFYDADIITHAIGQWCPLLTVTSVSVTADSFVIPQAAFLEPTTTGEIVRQTTRFSLRDWAVWDGGVFWLHDRGARGTAWRARVGPSGLEETGPQVDRLWESVIVAYQDVDGSTRTVGPVGSGADTETDDLKDDNPENPANRLGITRRDMLSVGISTAAGATEVGRRFLEETKALDSSGRARITGHVQDSSGVWHPYSHMRSGDTISFVDASDASARRIVRTDKSRDGRSCSIDLDSPPEGLQALLERLGAVLVPLGI